MIALTRAAILAVACVGLWACAGSPAVRSSSAPEPGADGPPDHPPPDVAEVPDAVPHPEPKSPYGNPDTYEVFGQTYTVLASADGYKERGYASWYGRKFQGQRTSSGEPYDMYQVTAAHKTLPLPTYVRVTDLETGKSVVVRVNDRGPFHSRRIIDLSYAAAAKLGILNKGEAYVEVTALTPGFAAPPPAAVASALSRPAGTLSRESDSRERATSTAGVLPAETSTAVPTADVAAAPEPRRPRQDAGQTRPRQDAGQTIYLEAGAFNDPINAVSLRERIVALGLNDVEIRVEPHGDAYLHRVLVGPFSDDGALEHARSELEQNRIPVARVEQ